MKFQKTWIVVAFLQCISLLTGTILLGENTLETKDTQLAKLQGTWESKSDEQNVLVTIKRNQLRFFRDDDFWFETTITLNTDVNPHRFRATIKRTTESQEEIVGESVPAIYKVEGDTLTILAYSDENESPPEVFEGPEGNLYELKKIQAKEKETIEGPVR